MKNAGVLLIGLLVFTTILSFCVVSAKFATEQQAITVGYQCLYNISNKTSSLSLEEAVFTTFALGFNNASNTTFNNEKSATEDCWPRAGCTLKQTAQVGIAYDFVGKNVSDLKKWLIYKNASATGIEWFLEVDAQNQMPATCTVREDLDSAPLNTFTINTDQKLAGNPGSCFTFARSNYLLKVNDNCLEKTFEISCNEDFLTTMLYKKSGSETYYVSSESHTSAPEGSTTENVGARCFKTGAECDYEGSLWTALALQQMGLDVTPFVPYILALSDEDKNKQFLPQAFAYMLTESSDSYAELTQSQQQNKYWRAATTNSRLFDTSLALTALYGTNAQEATKAKSYLLEIQDNSGCWNNKNLRDTAFILYAGWPQPNLPRFDTENICTTTSECPIGQTCQSGLCRVPTPTECTTNAHCLAGQTCVNNACQNTNVPLALTVNTPVQNGVYNLSVPVNLQANNADSIKYSIDTTSNLSYTVPTSVALINGTHTLTAHAINTGASTSITRTFSIVNSSITTTTCSTKSQCPIGFDCINSLCRKTTPVFCNTDSQCSSGQECTDGICQSSGGSGSSGRIAPIKIGNASTNTSGKSACEIAGFSCSSAFSCLDNGGILKSGYSCTGRLECCSIKPSSQQSCIIQEGKLCKVNEQCDGRSGPASDGSCCFGTCSLISASEQENGCEVGGYGRCSANCDNSEYDSGYSCTTPGYLCCSASTSEEGVSNGAKWFWIIFLLILVAAVIIAIVYRDKLKLWWFKMQNKKQPPRGPFDSSSQTTGILPRRLPQFGGFLPHAPQRPLARPGLRPGIRPANSSVVKPQPKPQPKDKELEETLKKLKEMSE